MRMFTSITHRITGVALFGGVGLLLWMLDSSLSSPEGFAAVKECLESFLSKFVLWAVMAAFIYHTVAGIRHLVMDTGLGETLEAGDKSAKLTVVLSAVLIILAGVWIW